jgi:lipopolysaccharide exporter
MMQILPIIGLTATPILSKTQSDEQRMARGYFLATEILMTVMAPMFLGLLVIAPTLVPLLLGDKWTESAPIFQVVCLNTLFYSFYFFSGALIIAKGRGLLGFGWRVGLLLATIAPAYLGAYYGKALGLASGIAAVTALAIVPYYLFVLRRLLGPCLGALARAIGIPVAMGAVMATVVAMLGSTLQGWNSVAALTIEIATGVLLYAALLLLFRPGIAREIMLVVPFGRIFGLLGSMRGAWLGRSS